jgi:hypothetical protein
VAVASPAEAAGSALDNRDRQPSLDLILA